MLILLIESVKLAVHRLHNILRMIMAEYVYKTALLPFLTIIKPTNAYNNAQMTRLCTDTPSQDNVCIIVHLPITLTSVTKHVY